MSEVYQGASPNARLLAGSTGTAPSNSVRVGNAFSVSLFTHIALFLAFLFILSLPVVPTPDSQAPLSLKDIVWIASPGPGGGGGGGGNKTPDPPRKAELPDKAKITVPAAKPPKMEAPEPPKQEQQITIPAQPVASGVEQLPGAVTNMIPTISLGSGTGGGAGTGTRNWHRFGRRIRAWSRRRRRNRWRRLSPRQWGVEPRLIREVKPNYTAEAMRAKIQGVVWIEAVVMDNGSVGPVHVTRSLDPTFGLDQEAERTVKKWVFEPGTRFGQPVPVLIEIEMSFTLR